LSIGILLDDVVPLPLLWKRRLPRSTAAEAQACETAW
jgi:hypothetical protein